MTDDIQLEMAKNQGYVPKHCYLKGEVVMMLMMDSRDPCKGCNLDRQKCGGRRRC